MSASELKARLPKPSWVPLLCAAVAAIVGLVNVASALTPGISWHDHLLLQLIGVRSIPVFHALTLPAGFMLILCSVYLAKRRRRAWEAATVLGLGLVAFNLLRDFDWDTALLSAVMAAVLWWGRSAFNVEHERVSLRSSLWRVPLLFGLLICAAYVMVLCASPDSSGETLLREALDLVLLQPGPLHFHRRFWSSVPLAVEVGSLITIASCAWLIFRPLAAPRGLPSGAARRAAVALVQQYGSDTLSFFKLRPDKQYYFNDAGTAFVGYRIESGVLMISGDPVGAPDELPGVITGVVAYAHSLGLRVGVLGASDALKEMYHAAGLRAFYIGDEAIVETASFTLEGRAIRKIRQSVTRLRKAGYETELLALPDISDELLAELDAVSERWRQGRPEIGFSMAMDSLRGDYQADSVVLVVRDETGTARGFLHFVPTYGRAAMSLSLMRRDRDTPNGMMEFMVVSAIEMLRERDIAELSLNFAAFARYLREPGNWFERVAGRLVSFADRYLQVESLYRFNAKFSPRWEPRYLCYDATLSFPRVGLAAMWVEGQLPHPGKRPTDTAPPSAA